MRLSAVLIAAVLCAGGWSTARAQEPPTLPQPYEPVDANGVDLTSGSLITDVETISVGDPQAGGLVDRLSFFSGGQAGVGWRHSLFGGIDRDRIPRPGVQPWYTVSVDGSSAIFVREDSGVFRLLEGEGQTLTLEAGGLTLTTKDGSVTTFQQGRRMIAPFRALFATPSQTVRPDGTVVTYHYNSVVVSGNTVYRLQSVTNNRGYQVHFEYASDVYNTQYSVITRSTAFNNAVDTCAPTANSCSYSRTWPSLTFSGNDVTDSLSRTTRFELDVNSLVVGISRPTTPVGRSYSVTWDTGRRQVSTFSDGAGTWTYSFGFSIDPPPYILTNTVTNPLTHTTTFAVDVSEPGLTDSGQTRSRIISSTNPVGAQTSYGYDEEGRLFQIGYPEGNNVFVGYNLQGNVDFSIEAPKPGSGLAARTTTAIYGDCSTPIRCRRPTAIIDARGAQTDYAYDAAGNLLIATPPAPTPGAVRPQTRYVYEQRNAWYMQGGSTAITPNPNPVWVPVEQSRCATAISCDGTPDEILSTTTYQVGSGGAASNLLPLQVSSGAGDGSLTATTTSTYDGAGDVVTVDGPLTSVPDVTHFYYDVMRQPVGQIAPDPDGGGGRPFPATRTVYNDDGQPTSAQIGTATAQTSSAFAAMTVLQRVDSLYDAQARKVRDTQSGGSTVYGVTQYAYDAMGRSTCSAVRMNPATFPSLPASACDLATAGESGPDRVAFSTYDAADRLLTTQTGYGTPDVRTVSTQTYTPNGKPDWIEDAQGNRSEYTYDGFDRVSQLFFPITTVGAHAANPSDYEEYGYDANDNPTSKRTRSGGLFVTTFDALNRITHIDAPSGSNDVAYAHDLLNRRLSASHPGGQVVSSTWDALSRQLTETGSLGTVTMTYDLAGRLTRQDWPGAVFYATYSWNLDDQVSSIYVNRFTNVATFYYDNLGRRTQIARPSSTNTHYAYDGASRLTTLTHNLAGTADDQTYSFTYSPADQMVTRDTTNSAYSFAPANNNNTYINNGLNQATTAGALSLSWDTRGNLFQIGPVTQTYDAANRLVTNGGGVLSYDPLDRLSRYTGTQGAVYGYAGSDEIAYLANDGVNINNRFVRGPWPDEILVSYAGTGTLTPVWWLQDHQQSTVAITDISGGAAAINRYDEYGRPAAGNAARFQYTGQLWLPDFGVYHYKARAYHPGLGRFMQTDPVGYAQALNLYAYVGNDPVNMTDPSGLIAQTGQDDPAATCDPNAPISQCQPLQDAIEEATELPDVVVPGNRPPPTPQVGIGIGSIYLTVNGNRILGAPFPYPYIYYSQGSNPPSTGGPGPSARASSPFWQRLQRWRRGSVRTDGRRLYEWDFTHSDIEVYNMRGEHLGSADPTTGEIIKPARPGRTIDVR